MSAIDRVMRAYTSKYVLTPAQYVLVREEITKFMAELMAGGHRSPAASAGENGGPAVADVSNGGSMSNTGDKGVMRHAPMARFRDPTRNA